MLANNRELNIERKSTMERSRKDRMQIVRSTLQNQDDRGIIVDVTPSQRMEMVWQLTLDAWMFMDPISAKSEFQRHVVRVERRQR
jgi:hypothetical protein